MSVVHDCSGPGTDWPPGTLMCRLSPAAGTALLASGVRRHSGPGTVLIRQGEHGSHVVMLWRSLVKVTVSTADGREALLDVRVSGDLIGEMGALNDRSRSATVTTCGDSVFTVIHRAELDDLLSRHPEIGLHLTAVVADRLRWANRRRIDFASYPVKVRLARILAELASVYGRRRADGVEIGFELIQPELATLAGAAEISVQRALRQLRSARLVATGYRRIVICDELRLRRLADLDADTEDA